MNEIYFIYVNIYNYTIYIRKKYNICTIAIFALKHQLSTQRYEPSATAHVVRKLLTAVVTFGTTTVFALDKNLPSKIWVRLVHGILSFRRLSPRRRYCMLSNSQKRPLVFDTGIF
jgi:hypothetical protein